MADLIVDYPVVPAANGLSSLTLWTGELDCSVQVRSYTVANPYDHPIYIRLVRRWMGTSYGSILDINHNLYVRPTGIRVIDGPWDRYAEPSGPHTEPCPFGPDYIEVVTGGWLELNVSCTPVVAPGVLAQPPNPTHNHAIYIFFLTPLSAMLSFR